MSFALFIAAMLALSLASSTKEGRQEARERVRRYNGACYVILALCGIFWTFVFVTWPAN